MAPRGQPGARLSPKPTPVTVRLRTGCQHGEEFCPPVHLIPESVATASPPALALMRRLDGSVWHTTGKEGMRGLPPSPLPWECLTFFSPVAVVADFWAVCVINHGDVSEWAWELAWKISVCSKTMLRPAFAFFFAVLWDWSLMHSRFTAKWSMWSQAEGDRLISGCFLPSVVYEQRILSWTTTLVPCVGLHMKSCASQVLSITEMKYTRK